MKSYVFPDIEMPQKSVFEIIDEVKKLLKNFLSAGLSRNSPTKHPCQDRCKITAELIALILR